MFRQMNIDTVGSGGYVYRQVDIDTVGSGGYMCTDRWL